MQFFMKLPIIGLMGLMLAFSSTSALAGNKFAKCTALYYQTLVFGMSTAHMKTVKKTCKSQNGPKGDRAMADGLNKYYGKWNKQGKKLFEAGRCDPALGLDANSFAYPVDYTEGDFSGFGASILAECDGS